MANNCIKLTSRILTIVLLLIGINVFAQESNEPFKKANVIIVHTDNSDSLNFKKFARHLMKFDYTLDKTDPEFLTISTKYHKLKTKSGWNYNYSYDIFFSDGQIIIKIHWILGLTIEISGVKMGDTPSRWKWTKGGAQNHCWKDVIEMLQDYCKCKITYKKQ